MTTNNYEPSLLCRLRTAIAHLYSLHNVNSAQDPKQQKEAHDVLLEFQSRNVRRKVLSYYQAHRDAQLKNNQGNANQSATTPQSSTPTIAIDENFCGSTVYACLSLLFNAVNNPPSHETEMLFAAQTILNRLRRAKLSEAIDWELEFRTGDATMNIDKILHLIDVSGQPLSLNTFHIWQGFVRFNCETLASFHLHFLGEILSRYYQDFWCDNANQYSIAYSTILSGTGLDMEERIKGELLIVVMASLAFSILFTHNLKTKLLEKQANNHSQDDHHPQHMHSIFPLLQTIFSSMAMIALRMRFSSSFHIQDTIQPITELPIVALITNTIQKVYDVSIKLPWECIILPNNHQYIEQLPSFHTLISKQLIEDIFQYTKYQCLCQSLAAIPDSILGNPGGARGRLSIDPRCLQSASLELKSFETKSLGLVKDLLLHLLKGCEQNDGENHGTSRNKALMYELVLTVCEQWAKFIPLPDAFIQQTIPPIMNMLGYEFNNTQKLSSKQRDSDLSSFEKITFQYLLRIYESATMSTDQILAASAGLTAELNNTLHQHGRKKQSSKSKKRQKEKIYSSFNNHDDNDDNDNISEKKIINEVEEELLCRKRTACCAAILSWDAMHSYVSRILTFLDSNPLEDVDGEGPIGCICTSASACLPYIIKHYNDSSTDYYNPRSLFDKLLETFKAICSNKNASVRSLTYEHIISVSIALADHGNISGGVEEISECVLTLANRCSYPPNYFNNWNLDSDEQLEMERHDVRDVIRSVTNVDGRDDDSLLVPLSLLDNVLESCSKSILSSEGIPLEFVMHTLSSLAKPLSCLASIYTSSSCRSIHHHHIEKIIMKCLNSLCYSSEKIISAFSANVSLTELLPISRLSCIATASYSPVFSSLAKLLARLNRTEIDEQFRLQFERAVGTSLLASIAAIINIPEVLAVSISRDNPYGKRGVMRGPGAEDHLGCIALSRCLCENDELTLASLNTIALIHDSNWESVIINLSNYHEELYRIEKKRCRNDLSGEGVSSTSRRILLTCICRLCCVAISNSSDTSSSISSHLLELVSRPLSTIIITSQENKLPDSNKFYNFCEAVFDLASFPSDIIANLLQSSDEQRAICFQGINIIVDAIVSGYKLIHVNYYDHSDVIIQFGRLRCAMVNFIRRCEVNMPQFSILSISSMIISECEAISFQLQLGPHSQSNIFIDAIIGDEMVPSGAFLIVIKELLEKVAINWKTNTLSVDRVSQNVSFCVTALTESKSHILSVLSSLQSEPYNDSYVDPRPTLAEAWFLSLFWLMKVLDETKLKLSFISQVQQLVSETIGLFIHLLTIKSIEKEMETKSDDSTMGLSLDGPQSLALIDFLDISFTVFGQDMLALSYHVYHDKMKLDLSNVDMSGITMTDSFLGGIIIISILYRGSSGSLPPWVTESIPNLYSSLCAACSDTRTFCTMLGYAADLKLQTGNDSGFGCIQPGHKLAGYFFDIMTDKAKDIFKSNINEVMSKDGNSRWRQLKVIIKALCGGKKKANSSLKPQPTNWDCRRV